jgi:hypothetical protein
MRTTFDEIHLFNDVSQKHDSSFILNGRSGESARQKERERERERGGVWVEKGWSVD